MRGRTLLILALAVAAAAGFVWFVERDLPTTEEREERAARIFDVESEDQVDRLELAFDDRKVVLERASGVEGEAASGEWRLVEPMSARADAAAARSLVQRLVGLDAARTLDDVEDPGEYGLEPPRLVVTLRAGDRSESLRFGDALPASDLRPVVAGESEEVHVVEGRVFDQATREPGEWRDPSLFPGERSAVDRVRLGSGDDSLLLGRRGRRFWVEAPYSDAADSERVEELLGAIVGLRAESFVDEPARTRDAAEGAGRIEVTLRDREAPVEILVGPELSEPAEVTEADEEPVETSDKETTRRLLLVDEQWAEGETDLGAFLGAEPSSWRSPALTAWPSYDIDTIRVEGEGDELTLTREGADWRRGEERILYSAASELLSAITRFRAREVEPVAKSPDPDPDHDPVLTLAITHVEGAEESFRFWRREDHVLVRPGGRQVLLRADSAAMESLESALDSARRAEALPESSGSDGRVE